jgi:hypothetical protein
LHRKKQIPRGEGKSQMKTKEWSVRWYKPKAKASEAVFFASELESCPLQNKIHNCFVEFLFFKKYPWKKKKKKPLLPFFCKDVLEKAEDVPNPPHEISCD